MSKLPKDDDLLRGFLRENRPTPPPADQNLETKILFQLAANTPAHRQISRSQKLWFLPSALAAGLLMAWGGYQRLMPPPTNFDNAKLEAFIESNWSEASDNNSDTDLSLLLD